MLRAPTTHLRLTAVSSSTHVFSRHVSALPALGLAGGSRVTRRVAPRRVRTRAATPAVDRNKPENMLSALGALGASKDDLSAGLLDA